MLAATGAFAQAGAPPNGFTAVSPSPVKADSRHSYGQNTKLVLDSNGEPVTAFLWGDPNGDGNFSDGTIYFSSWNHGQAKFNQPVKVAAATGDISSTGATQPFGLARDTISNQYGVAYRKIVTGGEELHLATSTDNGATWQDVTVVQSSGVQSPSLQLHGGTVYLAWRDNNTGPTYITGKASDPPSQWASQPAPHQPGYDPPYFKLSLALDSSGAPGLAYMLNADSSKDIHLLFWRPGAAMPTTISGTNGFTTDDPDIELAFDRLQPRIVFLGAMDSSYATNFDHKAWEGKSADGGATWGPLQNIPADHHSSFNSAGSLAIGSLGQGALATASNSGTGDATCGTPKIALSDNSFTNWQTCGPAANANLDVQAQSPSAVYGPNDRLYVVFQNTNAGSLPYGVNLWSMALNTPAPVISAGGVLNGASFASQVSPGALTTVFGSNFASAATSASQTPLPASLAGLSVNVNGEPAPVIFANATQINFQIPWDIPTGMATINVSANGVLSNSIQFPVIAAAPGIIVYSGTRAVATDAVNTLLGPTTPAAANSTIILYMIGSGPVSNEPSTGAVSPTSPLSYVQSSVSASIGGKPAVVSFAGLTPNFVGLLQLNIVVPSGLTPGDQPLIVTIKGVPSNSAMLNVGP